MTDTEIPADIMQAAREIAASSYNNPWHDRFLSGELDDENEVRFAVLGLLAERRRHTVEAQPVPDGWQLVPKEPPLDMVRAGSREVSLLTHKGAEHCYKAMLSAAPTPPSRAEVTPEWQPIETAPKDGTVIDLWHEEFGRTSDCYWGKPQHCCGEYGSYCDSDWHGEADGWVFSTMNEYACEAENFTHWMPLPAAPALGAGKKEGVADVG